MPEQGGQSHPDVAFLILDLYAERAKKINVRTSKGVNQILRTYRPRLNNAGLAAALVDLYYKRTRSSVAAYIECVTRAFAKVGRLPTRGERETAQAEIEGIVEAAHASGAYAVENYLTQAGLQTIVGGAALSFLARSIGSVKSEAPRHLRLALNRVQRQLSTGSSTKNVFQRNGESWLVAFGGKSAPALRHAKGLSYIAALLARPNEEINVWDLGGCLPPPTSPELVQIAEAQSLGSNDEDVDSSDGELLRIVTPRADHGLEVADPIAIREIERQLARLENEMELFRLSGNIDRMAEFEDRAATLKEHLSRAKRMGRPRTTLNPNERKRKEVLEAIRRAREGCVREFLPGLATHLKESIKPGPAVYTYQYTPPQPTDWVL